MGTLEADWQTSARLVAELRDVIDARAIDDVVPPPLVARGWAACLDALHDEDLAALERDGLDARWPAHTPRSLLELLAATPRAVCAVPALARGPAAARPQRRSETPRKRAQVDAFAEVIRTVTGRAARVLDVGSGHGHLTRELAEGLAVPVVGLERDGAFVARARALAAAAPPSFRVTDVLNDGLSVAPDDCVVGLHACGELGDAMVVAAARAGSSLALVGCCLQKRRQTARAPLCPIPALGDALALPTRVLGLSNLTLRDETIEAPLAVVLAARERRLALRRLLADRGVALRAGAEIAGLNRRAPQGTLAALAERACVVHGVAAPTPAEVAEAAAWARVQYARIRRWSLPRAVFARVLEVYVLHDRARHLEAAGHATRVGTLFDAAVSPRNLALLAAAPAGRAQEAP